MARLTKDEFILRMLSKITRKKWENYTIHRIIHRLDDPDIEFACQQYVSRPDGGYGLIDLYFPQFNISLEIDEPPHEREKHKRRDDTRSKDIIAVTGCDERRWKIRKTERSNISLEELHDWIDDFVSELRLRKEGLGENFAPWDYETRYDPETHIARGFIDSSDNVAFVTHRDALRCFGYKKGHLQKAVWRIPKTRSWVWFPKFYENNDWDNSLSEDGKTITETYKGEDPKHLNREDPVNTRIVFAHDRDALGYTLYRFLGEYIPDPEGSNARTRRYILINTRIDLRQYFDQEVTDLR